MSLTPNPDLLRVLMIGDIVGKGGRQAAIKLVPQLRKEFDIHAVIANVENLAHGKGITEETLDELFAGGVDFGTSGNHIYDKPQGITYLNKPDAKVVRPANFPIGSPGKGVAEITVAGPHGEPTRLLIINLIGQVFMEQEADSPFLIGERILDEHDLSTYGAVLIDLHAEATSEIQGLAFYLDGKASAVVSTHTHVPTADLRRLPKGTYCVCDLGSVGGSDSILGFGVPEVLDRFINSNKTQLHPVETGPMTFNSVLFEINPSSREVVRAIRVDREISV